MSGIGGDNNPGNVGNSNNNSQNVYHPDTTSDQMIGNGNDSNKRTALTGQWRTPPTMLFFPGMSNDQKPPPDQQQQQQQQQQQNFQQLPFQQQQTQQLQHPYQQQQVQVQVVRVASHGNLGSMESNLKSSVMAPVASSTSLSSTEGNLMQSTGGVVYSGVPTTLVATVPHSTEDYAKALQEAYRRGAEAAAMAAAAQVQVQVLRSEGGGLTSIGSNHNLVTAVSCPDFQISQQHQPTQSYVSNQHTSIQYHPVSNASASMSMPPPPPVTSSGVPDPMQYQTSSMVMQQSGHRPGSMMIQQQPQVVNQQPPQQAVNEQKQQQQQPPPPPQQQQPPPQQQQQQQQQQQRSVSLPDMSSYAAQQEEEKRQKRLARNRASARLRRLRKKNLVDAYEVEVGILEKTLQLLKEHEWGGDVNETGEETGDEKKESSNDAANNEGRASALAAALSMDRGQQPLTAEQRKETASDILQQQLQFLEQLESLLQEQFILHEVARMHISGGESKDTDDTGDNLDDLKEILQLSDEQIRELHLASANWEEEWNALQTVKASLLAMKENDWLWNEGCIETADQFLRILHKNQISKFLLWCDHNVEAIDELDVVNARPLQSMSAGPIFSFGVDSHPGDFLDDEK